MVAKQGWFLMENPHALVSRIFKARYFSRTGLFEAKLGYNPSYVWRSIWKAREVLTLGCRWRIGDGRNIRVMDEPWLRGSREGCLMGPQKQGVFTLTVNDLLLPNVKQWNMRVLCDLFDYSVVRDILHVPLAEAVQEDRLVWKEDVNGNYSVRSGYRIWRKSQERISSGREKLNWSSLWKITAPTRVKHLIWRICSDCLPSKTEGLLDIISPRLQTFHDIKSLILDICTKEDRKTAGRVAVMLEGLWKNRNDFVWHNEKEDASKLGWMAFHRWQEWFLAQNLPETNSDIGDLVIWNPPSFGCLKCNVDAAFNQRVGTTNRGWGILNDHGDFVTAGTAWDNCTFSVLEAEALAIKEAIQSATTLHNIPVIFESDSQQVVKAFSSSSSAKAANSWTRRCMFDEIPPCITSYLINESS
ncbi:uncharacterized protein LOC131596935 [Vicia villosa]|uniref:uncharacterized protein LOC131596935 n=1 Tax=Vicia villosa TaxID=3911 RepID=UPI00273C7E6D|nr:uncharacterized protein LOC131596935 [Vicia villosa]